MSDRELLQKRVETQLRGLVCYAEGAAETARRNPTLSTAPPWAYIKSSLITLLHLGLITHAEHAAWKQRLLQDLSPTEDPGS